VKFKSERGRKLNFVLSEFSDFSLWKSIWTERVLNFSLSWTIHIVVSVIDSFPPWKWAQCTQHPCQVFLLLAVVTDMHDIFDWEATEYSAVKNRTRKLLFYWLSYIFITTGCCGFLTIGHWSMFTAWSVQCMIILLRGQYSVWLPCLFIPISYHLLYSCSKFGVLKL